MLAAQQRFGQQHAVGQPFARLAGRRFAFVRPGDDAARKPARIGFQRDALAIATVHARNVHAGVEQPARAFEKHPADRRIDAFHRAVRTGWPVGRAVGVFVAHRPLRTFGIAQRLEFGARQRGNGTHETGPFGGPAVLQHRFARQAEGEVERAQPRAGPAQEGFEACPGRKAFDPSQVHCAVLGQVTGCDGDRLAGRRGGGEIDAVQRAHEAQHTPRR